MAWLQQDYVEPETCNMLRYIWISILSLSILSCGNNNKGENDSIPQDTTVIPTTSSSRVTIIDTPDPNPQPVVTEKRPPQNGDTVRFMVAFISKGMGIDLKQKQKLDVWLAKQPGVKFSISTWGREGEMNYCFPLKNTSASDQQTFIRDLKSQITNKDIVYFYENMPCNK